jgi:hypothetical protein
MSPITIGISSAVLATGYFLDIIFSRSRHRIYDKFLAWWYWLSNLRVKQAINRSIALTIRVLDWFCGRKTFSVGSIVRGALIVALLAALWLFWFTRNDPSPFHVRVIGILFLILPAVPPAVLVLMITRVILRHASRNPNFLRLVALGITNLLVVQLGVELIAFLYGVCAQAWIDAAYSHHVRIEDTEAMLGSGYAFFFVFSHFYGYLALLPAILFAGLFACWMAIFIASALCRLIEEFLRLQVEESAPRRPFTALATVFCMATALVSPIAIFVGYFDVKYQFQMAENAATRSVSQMGEKWISARPNANFAQDKEYLLYNLQCKVFLAGIEFLGPTQYEIRNVRAIVSRIKNEWAAPNESNLTPSPTATPAH